MGGQAGGEKAPAARRSTRSSPSLSSAAFRWWARTFSPTHPSWQKSSEQKQEGATHVQDGTIAHKYPEDGRSAGVMADAPSWPRGSFFSKVCPCREISSRRSGRNSLSSPNLKQKHLKEGRRKSWAQGQPDGHQTFSSVDPRQRHIQLLITDGCFQLHEVTPD